MKVHFIAIGGSVMHKLAIDLKNKGWLVTGSDDKIYGSSKENLSNAGILPEQEGWDVERIHPDLDFVIIGMHAKQDNPELRKAEELNLKILSFPDFVYTQSLNKQRIVIAGSHGKTTISSILLHILNIAKKEFDFVIGASVAGFEEQVRLTDAPTIVIEGDEYLSSAIDRIPKFLKYHHHIVLISGISWDHANVFPTEEDYSKQFKILADRTPKSGTIVYNEEDNLTVEIGQGDREDVNEIGYKTLPYKVIDGIAHLTYKDEQVPLRIYGEHNVNNISGAIKILEKLGISKDTIIKGLVSFEGAEKRLQTIYDNGSKTIIKDFAHAPSKVSASVRAVHSTNSDRKLIACLELHTFSSLNKNFLPNYKASMDKCDEAIVYFNPENVITKGLDPLTENDLIEFFDQKNLKVFTSKDSLLEHLKESFSNNSILLLMSSGTFNSMDISQLQ